MNYRLDQLPPRARFSALPEHYFRHVAATPLRQPQLAAWNTALASELGLASNPDEHGMVLAEILSGNRPLPGHPTLATVYSGHQFGVNVPQLGDGRALLIAEFDDTAGRPRELQLKGAGPTPFSRRADGRAVLRSSIREYLCSEAMHALGIPTTRALALIHDPQTPVWRETRESAAVVSRVAPTFLRFGHFEYFYYQGRHDAVRELADWALQHHFPDEAQAEQPYLALFNTVIARTAALIASWQGVGFCHGVMNTDNMSLLGLTLDYGPFGFMDGFDAGHVCNHSDETGRYAYQQQPRIALWNLYCLGQALTPLLEKEEILEALDTFQPAFEHEFGLRMAGKLGLKAWQDADWTLLTSLLDLLQTANSDWTIFWRTLSHNSDKTTADSALLDLVADREAFTAWFHHYQQRLDRDPQTTAERRQTMLASNPAYVLRNHLAEQAIRQAEDELDYSEIRRLADCLARPFTENPVFSDYARLPPDWAKTLSVSCSS